MFAALAYTLMQRLRILLASHHPLRIANTRSAVIW